MVDGGRSDDKEPLSWSWLVSRKRKCREKRKRERERERERERPIFLGLFRKLVKPLHRTCTAHKVTGCPLKEVLKARVGK